MNETIIRIVACFVMLACAGLVIIRDREARNATLVLTDGRVIEKAQMHFYAFSSDVGIRHSGQSITIPVNQIRAFSVASGDVSLGMWAWVAMGAGAVLLVLIGTSVVDVVRTVKTKG